MNDLSRPQLEALLAERDHRVIDPGVFQNVVRMALKWSDHAERQKMLWALEKEAGTAPQPQSLKETVQYDSGEV